MLLKDNSKVGWSAEIVHREGGFLPNLESHSSRKIVKKMKAREQRRRAAYPINTTVKLSEMMRRFERSGRSQNVSFRRLVNWIKVGERATHYLHSYPAKLLPQIAHFFLAADNLSQPGDIVLDPFGGTGTVAVEAILAGRTALFSDVNPLARLIARVKTRKLNEADIDSAFRRIQRAYPKSGGLALSLPPVVNLNYWYSTKTAKALCRIRLLIMREKDGAVREFFLVCFSQASRKVSNADPRLSVPVRRKGTVGRNLDAPGSKQVWQIFCQQVSSNIARMTAFSKLSDPRPDGSKAFCVGNDARNLRAPSSSYENTRGKLKSESVSLIITSPPYAGAQKYIRASSLGLGWVGLADVNDLKILENASIGREHFPKASGDQCPSTGISAADRIICRVYQVNRTRSVIAASYINEMKDAISEMVRVLKPGGRLVLVIGNNEVCNLPFKSSEYLLTICQRLGLILRLKLIDEIKSRGLMTKRNKTASVIAREWVLLLEKPKKTSREMLTFH